MSHQYRAWRDYLSQMIEDNMPAKDSYALLHTASMVGLFSCIFVKTNLRSRVHNLNVTEIKRGLGGLHGNKVCNNACMLGFELTCQGAIIVRFMIDDTSLCFTNCHLAAGQTQTVNRNNDIAAILEASCLPAVSDPEARINHFVGGGDGSMILDHEICILNGDLNYRIDTMSRDTVVKAINAKNLNKLLERDQLLVSKRRNPGFRLRAFQEQPITFAPTYKYDVGTDRYDTSEKNRSPAWCDRLLYRGAGRVKQIEYCRHELQLSDHRPVSGLFLMRLKNIDPKRRMSTWNQCEERLDDMRHALAQDAK
jgi:endonuclease/exonuclease/phosphatase family metal-dependent hydrolase